MMQLSTSTEQIPQSVSMTNATAVLTRRSQIGS